MLSPAACHVSNKLPRYSEFLKGESNVLKIANNDETKLSKQALLERELSNTKPLMIVSQGCRSIAKCFHRSTQEARLQTIEVYQMNDLKYLLN